MINKIDHLGIAVKSIDETAKYYETTLGLKCLGREEVPATPETPRPLLIG